MLNLDLHHCQINLPWVPSVNVYLLNYPVRMWGRISSIFCYLKMCLAKELVKAWCFKRCFNRLVGTVLFPGANVCLLFPGEGSGCGSLGWNASGCGSLPNCKGWTCGLHSWDPGASWQADTRNLCVILMRSWIWDPLLVCSSLRGLVVRWQSLLNTGTAC